MTPRATFVIPAHNAECWISKAIGSCRGQSVKQIEIVVVNDASTDSTREIIDWHAKEDKRVVPVHLAENVGSAQARNIGNTKASGQIILVLDADDLAMKNRVKDTLTFFELKKPDVTWGAFFEINSLGITGMKVPADAFNPVLSQKTKLNFICHSTMAYRKGVTLNVPYDTGEYGRLVIYDWKFQWDCHRKGYSLKHIKTPLSYYRNRKSSQSAVRNQSEVAALKDAYLNEFVTV